MVKSQLARSSRRRQPAQLEAIRGSRQRAAHQRRFALAAHFANTHIQIKIQIQIQMQMQKQIQIQMRQRAAHQRRFALAAHFANTHIQMHHFANPE